MGFEALISILAELYPTSQDARRIIAQASIDHRRVDFSGSAIRFWYDIFIVANREDHVFDLLAAVEDEYSDSAEFMRQSRMYYRDVAQTAINANDDRKSYSEDGAGMATVIDQRRMEIAEEDIRSLKKMQAEMIGELRTLNRMLDTLLSSNSIKQTSVTPPSPYLFASIVAIVFLIAFILYMLANGGV